MSQICFSPARVGPQPHPGRHDPQAEGYRLLGCIAALYTLQAPPLPSQA
jgi:hypothetical protein